MGLAVALMAPNLLWGPSLADSASYNHVWVAQFAEGLGRGELYPRWLPRSFEGLGSPTFYFYPPLAFYLPALLDLLGLTTPQAINAAFLAATVASGAAMHAWLRLRGGRALLGAALYMAAPYHLFDLYVRGGLAEHAAFVWIPLLAMGVAGLPDRRAIALLAASYAGLILTHLPVALLATVFLLLPLGLARAARSPRLLVPGVTAIALGLGLAAIYLLPALTLQEHISSELSGPTPTSSRGPGSSAPTGRAPGASWS